MNIRRTLFAMVILGLAMVVALIYFPREIKVIEYRCRGYEIQSTPHFSLLFKAESREEIPVVARAAEQAYAAVGQDFHYYPAGKIPIIIYPESDSLQIAFNWPRDEKNQGVYHRDVIYIQAPSAWVAADQSLESEFFVRGPMVHEYTHLVTDHLTAGNYSRWFTEGVAQYEEQRVTGYTLEQDFAIDKNFYYSPQDMFFSFDQLPDVPRAYIQALEMTTQLVGEGGLDEIRGTLLLLRAGASANELFLQRAGKPPFEGKHLFVTNITYGGDLFE